MATASTRLTFADFAPTGKFQPAVAISPDGGEVVFISNVSGQPNLWHQEVGLRRAKQLTHFSENAVRDVAWSPDGRHLAFAADFEGDEFHQIFVLDLDAGGSPAPRAITAAPKVQHHLAADGAFSPDSRLIAYAGNDRDPTSQDVLVHDLHTGESRRVLAGVGIFTPIAFSPDGQYLSVARDNSNTDTELFVVDLANPGEPAPVTPHSGEVKYRAGGWLPVGDHLYAVTDAGREFTGLAALPVTPGEPRWIATPPWDVERVEVSGDGSRLAWTVNEDGYSRLHVHDIAADDEVRLPHLPLGVILALELSHNGNRLAFLLASARRPVEVYVLDLVSSDVHVLTDSLPAALRSVDPIEPTLVRFPAYDDRPIPAFLYRPPGEGPFPVVLSIHGGPEAQERPVYSYAGLYQYLLAHGIAVLAPNIRGSNGYGSTYQRLIHRDWGGDDLRDFDSCARFLQDADWVDPSRIAVFGASYGGFAVLTCVSRLPDVWAAAVDIVGPANLVTLTRSVPPTWRRQMAAWVGDPDTEADFLLARSPVTYADDIVTPLYVIQGAHDPRVVQAESDQIVSRLRERGVDVRYDVYEDEGHGFTKRANEIRAIGDAAGFLLDHLGA
jgi:dipeptidyl aminopeptidase/acylaminoacyl peptidase